MKLSYSQFQLQFRHPFGVSSNTRTTTPVVFLKLDSGEHTGYGEACVPVYLGETQQETIAFFEKARGILNATGDQFSIVALMNEIDSLSDNCNAAKAAIDIALHDLAGKKESKTMRDFYEIPAFNNIATSCTIGLDHADKIAMKIKEAADFKILKIKAGSDNDKALINMIRSYTDKPLYVDVNQGWKDKYYVLDMLHYLAENNVLIAEQPMPADQLDDMAWVSQQSPIPVIADESVRRFDDIEKISGAFSGVNLKLMKSSGINEAIRMIEKAREKNLKVMLGCMAESSCATTAMAHLAGMADYVDLDAPNLIVNDPFRGITYRKGEIVLPSDSGIGISLNEHHLLN